MQLSRTHFLVLHTMAEGAQPFSSVFLEAGRLVGPKATLPTIAEIVCDLVEAVLVSRVGVADPGVGATGLLRELITHYAALLTELRERKSQPFWYSRGELSFALTPKGLAEWRHDRYRPFWPTLRIEPGTPPPGAR